MTKLLADETIVVTGGASGIGRSIAIQSAKEGADVVVADVRPTAREGKTATVKTITEETDADAKFVECDVRNRADIRNAVDHADAFGGISTMVNNAGVLHRDSLLEMDESTIDRMIEVNLKGTVFGCQVAAERMLPSGGGNIINISSVSGLRGQAGFAVYCATKGAIRLLTYALADEFGPKNINVNTIHPGATETAQAKYDSGVIDSPEGDQWREKIPLRRFGEPEDIADVAVFLASDMSGYLNGESITVDGGVANTS